MATLGEKLRAARLAKGVSASEAAAATRLKVQIIEGLEDNNFSTIAATVYGKGFIRLYAEYLGLEPMPLIEDYLMQCGVTSGASSAGGEHGEVLENGPDLPGEQRAVDRSRVGIGRDDGYKDDVPQNGSFQQMLERIRITFIEEPVTCSLVGFVVLVLFIFLLSGLTRCAGF